MTNYAYINKEISFPFNLSKNYEKKKKKKNPVES